MNGKMARLFVNRKLVRNPKFCRFCANHKISVLEKGHRSKCEYRFCTCSECSKNAKKVQTSKDHRKKKDVSQNSAVNIPAQNIPLPVVNEPISQEVAANETTMTLKTFIESNLDAYFEDLSRGASDAIQNGSGHAAASSYIQSLPMICVDSNMNEIESFPSTDTPVLQFVAAVAEQQEQTRDSMVQSLMAEHGTDIPLLCHALLNACGDDYAEAVRRIADAKNKCQRNDNMNS